MFLLKPNQVPGCSGAGVSGKDYCYKPVPNELTLVGNDGFPERAFPLQRCQADCDSHEDCSWGLLCFFRSDRESIPDPVCTGQGEDTEDYCIKMPGYLVIAGEEGFPAENYPLEMCQGNCRDDADCAGSLTCTSGTSAGVAGCGGSTRSGVRYCYDANPTPTFPPDEATYPPFGSPEDVLTYVPGEATVFENGLVLSTGLTSRIIATKYQRVSLDTGGTSSESFHSKPDGAAVFLNEETGGWAYVTNSEDSESGGVGAIYFDSQGRVIDYKMLLRGTRRNCGGGKTPWQTWITCEERDGGRNWEVDPWKPPGSSTVTVMGSAGGDYESFAYDVRDPSDPKFFVTVDREDGPLVRFTPEPSALQYAQSSGDYQFLLHTPGDGVKHEYVKIEHLEHVAGSKWRGTFSWTPDIEEGASSAAVYFQNGEGIDIRNGLLYFTSKVQKFLYIFDLDNMTFERTSTQTGAFDHQPDQVARVLDTDGSTDGVLYFCEDGSKSGVHGRTAQGSYFTILEGTSSGGMSGETTGLAFSPDGKIMYLSFQDPGKIVEVRRLDGYPFQGQRLDIKYHADVDSNTSPFRD